MQEPFDWSRCCAFWSLSFRLEHCVPDRPCSLAPLSACKSMWSHLDGEIRLAGQDLSRSEQHMAEFRITSSRRHRLGEVVKCSTVVWFRSLVLCFLVQNGVAKLVRPKVPLRRGQSSPCHRRGPPTPSCWTCNWLSSISRNESRTLLVLSNSIVRQPPS